MAVAHRHPSDSGGASSVVRHRLPLDAGAMSEAAGELVGRHDFAAFCRPRPGATTIRTLQVLDVSRPATGPDAKPYS